MHCFDEKITHVAFCRKSITKNFTTLQKTSTKPYIEETLSWLSNSPPYRLSMIGRAGCLACRKQDRNFGHSHWFHLLFLPSWIDQNFLFLATVMWPRIPNTSLSKRDLHYPFQDGWSDRTVRCCSSNWKTWFERKWRVNAKYATIKSRSTSAHLVFYCSESLFWQLLV